VKHVATMPTAIAVRQNALPFNLLFIFCSPFIERRKML